MSEMFLLHFHFPAFTRPSRRIGAVLALLCLIAFEVAAPAWADPNTDPPANLTNEGDLPGLQGVPQPAGKIVPIDIGSAGFDNMTEYVYLPPAWFATKTPPQLPVVMMINGDHDTPQRWINSGNAVDTADAFAAQHGGNAPILVFVDTAGRADEDTECVNGAYGAVEDHLVREVPAFVISHFQASGDPAKWGIVGWSMGGTCAVDLAAMHPERFSGFVDIAGYLRPDAGGRDDTIENLYGGNAPAFDLYDPIQAMNKHGKYARTAGWFQVSGDPDADRDTEGSEGDLSGVNPNVDPAAAIHLAAAKQLCGAARHVGIACAVVARMGVHRWPFAAGAFAESLPWLAGYLQTPGVPGVLLPVR